MKVAQKPKSCMNELVGNISEACEESKQSLLDTPSSPGVAIALAIRNRRIPRRPQGLTPEIS